MTVFVNWKTQRSKDANNPQIDGWDGNTETKVSKCEASGH